MGRGLVAGALAYLLAAAIPRQGEEPSGRVGGHVTRGDLLEHADYGPLGGVLGGVAADEECEGRPVTIGCRTHELRVAGFHRAPVRAALGVRGDALHPVLTQHRHSTASRAGKPLLPVSLLVPRFPAQSGRGDCLCTGGCILSPMWFTMTTEPNRFAVVRPLQSFALPSA